MKIKICSVLPPIKKTDKPDFQCKCVQCLGLGGSCLFLLSPKIGFIVVKAQWLCIQDDPKRYFSRNYRIPVLLISVYSKKRIQLLYSVHCAVCTRLGHYMYNKTWIFLNIHLNFPLYLRFYSIHIDSAGPHSVSTVREPGTTASV